MGYITDIFDNEELSAKAKYTYCLLARFVNSDGLCWPSLQTLAKRGGIAKTTLYKPLKELQEKGFILIEKAKTPNGDYDVNKYLLPHLVSSGVGVNSTNVGVKSTNVGRKLTNGRFKFNQQVGVKSTSKYPNRSSTRSNINIPNVETEEKTPYREIIDCLNQACCTNYRLVEKHKTSIRSRFAEGHTLDDFKTVIDKKAREWLGTDQAKYLRPETLFGTKFDSYLNQLGNNPKVKPKRNEPGVFEC